MHATNSPDVYNILKIHTAMPTHITYVCLKRNVGHFEKWKNTDEHKEN